MLAEFRLYHKAGGNHQDLKVPEGFWHFGTCMRSIVVSLEDHIPNSLKSYDFYRGESAYRFLLEVICGMHSPLIGETEILGQFKNFHREYGKVWPSLLQEIFQALNADAKQVRQKHLQNIGCHSYGSLLRKTLAADIKAMHFLGAGQLVEEILPWFKKAQFPMSIFTRDPEKHRNLKTLDEKVHLHPITDIAGEEKGAVLVVAAPVSAQWIQSQCQLQDYAQVIDLRGDCQQDPLPHHNLKTLHQMFHKIEKQKEKAVEVKSSAQQMIIDTANQRYLMEKPRPFGWEDLWACS
ncbi:MAG: hypothetical protein KDD33_12115 [Bdellovibrionales bacterium]|nr:hypothetical protein [Bdellovibrionales bacterium]